MSYLNSFFQHKRKLQENFMQLPHLFLHFRRLRWHIANKSQDAIIVFLLKEGLVWNTETVKPLMLESSF